jgi:uncharacterized membrane protein YfcA
MLGGFLIVPLMRRFTHLAMPGIVATSLSVITLVGCSGVLNAVLSGAELTLVETTILIATIICEMLVGRGISRKPQPWQVQRAFALLVSMVSIYMLLNAYLSITA